MVRRPFIVAFTGLLLTLFGGCTTSHLQHVASDLSTPKSAALTFLHAISAGDVDTAKNACVGTDQEKSAVEAISTLITGLRAYDNAITTRFRVEAVQTDSQLRQAISDLFDVSIPQVEGGIVKEGPEEARVEPGMNGVRLQARPPLFLKKDKGGWKIDLALTAQSDRRFSSETASQYEQAGNALKKAARRINSGQYKTFAEAQQAADGTVP